MKICETCRSSIGNVLRTRYCCPNCATIGRNKEINAKWAEDKPKKKPGQWGDFTMALQRTKNTARNLDV